MKRLICSAGNIEYQGSVGIVVYRISVKKDIDLKSVGSVGYSRPQIANRHCFIEPIFVF